MWTIIVIQSNKVSPRCLDKHLPVLKRHRSLKISCVGITNILQSKSDSTCFPDSASLFPSQLGYLNFLPDGRLSKSLALILKQEGFKAIKPNILGFRIWLFLLLF